MTTTELKNISLKDLFKKLEQVHENTSCKPDTLALPKKNEVLDENKSVKWNREEVERRREAYFEEVKRLNRERNKAISDVESDICQKIMRELNHPKQKDRHITEKGATAMYYLAYERGHAYGFLSVYNELSELMDLMETVLYANDLN